MSRLSQPLEVVNSAEISRGLPSEIPEGWHNAQIVICAERIAKEITNTDIAIQFQVVGSAYAGERLNAKYPLTGGLYGFRAKKQRQLIKLLSALSINSLDDTDQLLFKETDIKVELCKAGKYRNYKIVTDFRRSSRKSVDVASR